MKGVFRFLIILLCCIAAIQCKANHIFGGELLYTYVSDSTYKLSLTLYGDCSANSDLVASLNIATPSIRIYHNSSYYDSVSLQPYLVDVEVSPVCPSQINNTYCKGGTLPGVKKYIYTATATILNSGNWQFVFDGYMGQHSGSTGVQAGRSQSITNVLTTGMPSLMEIEADLYNPALNNSSPQYTTIPTPFYCVNIQEQYNQGAIDPNGDSLAYSLVPAIDGRTGSSANYVSPYTATSPLSTDSGAFVFNTLTGQFTFTANITQDALVVNRISEYKNGVLVGTSEREMTFIVLDNCTSTPATATISHISGGVLSSANTIGICTQSPSVSFDIYSSDINSDTITASYTNLPNGAAVSIDNNNTAGPVATFSWNTAGLMAGTYTFYGTYKANSCPLSSTQTIAYTIIVANPPVITVRTISPTECHRQAYMEYDIAGGVTPRTVTITENGTTVKTYRDSTGIIKDSLGKGDYIITTNTDSSCNAAAGFSIIDTGNITYSNNNVSYCVNAIAQPLVTNIVNTGATLVWLDAEDDTLSGAPTPNTADIGTTYYYAYQHYLVCTGIDTIAVIVHPLPDVTTGNVPGTVCYGDTVFLTASGADTYTWTPASQVTIDSGQVYAHLFTPVTFTVTGTDQYGCVDSASVAYNDIQLCCTFSYPNAFTPNGDTRNDKFRVVTYGNMLYYELFIYNRYGQMVFYTTDPDGAWDGTMGGRPCDIGTYFYYLHAKCDIGKEERHKGDITLVR